MHQRRGPDLPSGLIASALRGRVHGTVFVDTATAFDERPRSLAFATGVGAELRLQIILGYYGSYLLRAGYARGLTAGGVDQPYAVLGFAY